MKDMFYFWCNTVYPVLAMDIYDYYKYKTNYNKKSVSKSKVSCGYGQSWGKISVTFDNKAHIITANDPN